MKLWVVVPAAGAGTRFGAGIPKQYCPLADKPVIVHTLERLRALEQAGLMVALAAGDHHWDALARSLARPPETVVGGATRAESVLAALASLATRADGDDWVLVHDAARPCVTSDDMRALISAVRDDPVGGILAAPVSDTVKRVAGGRIERTLDRDSLWAALTPQLFRYAVLKQGLKKAAERNLPVSDEAAAVELLGHHPVVVPGRRDNIKITRAGDLALAEAIIRYQQAVDAAPAQGAS